MNQPDHSARDHAEFSPSSLKYVASCPAYKGRDGSSAASEMGTRIHEALEVRDPSALHNEEEVEIYDKIVKMEEEFMSNFGGIAEEHNEIQVTVALDGTETWGTCDRFLILQNGNAVMADYKTGISIIDPPEKNWQAKAYVVGAFQKFPEVQQITFVFYVPQHDASLHHTFERSDVGQMVAELTRVIKAAEATRPKWDDGSIDIEHCRPTQYCRFCQFEDRCPALGAVALEVAKRYDASLLPDGEIRSSEVDDPDTLEKLYVVAKIVENWASGIKNKALQMANDGYEFKTLKKRSLGSLKKTLEKQYLAELAMKHGLELSEILEASDLKLTQLSKALHDKAPKGKKSFVVDSFEQQAIDLGIVEIGSPRYTLTSR